MPVLIAPEYSSARRACSVLTAEPEPFLATNLKFVSEEPLARYAVMVDAAEPALAVSRRVGHICPE